MSWNMFLDWFVKSCIISGIVGVVAIPIFVLMYTCRNKKKR